MSKELDTYQQTINTFAYLLNYYNKEVLKPNITTTKRKQELKKCIKYICLKEAKIKTHAFYLFKYKLANLHDNFNITDARAMGESIKWSLQKMCNAKEWV